MKYFLDTEFIEGFTQPFIGRSRHFIDLVSIGIVDENGRTFSAISSEYSYQEASPWVKEHVLEPLYLSTVHRDARYDYSVYNFHKSFGRPLHEIRTDLLAWFSCTQTGEQEWTAPAGIEIYGYYADYDWVLFCSLFGRMIDLPKGFPMYCQDLKQMMDERGLTKEWKREFCPDPAAEHLAIVDAAWNKDLYSKIIAYGHQHYRSL